MGGEMKGWLDLNLEECRCHDSIIDDAYRLNFYYQGEKE